MMKRKMYVIIFFLILLIPNGYYIYKFVNKSVETKFFNVTPLEELTKNQKVTQKIFIPNHIKKYGIMFGTYERKNKGKLKIKIIQDKVIVEQIIDIKNIKNNSFLYLDKTKIKKIKGEALLEITSLDGETNHSVTLYTSDDISLGSITLNGVSYEKGLIQHIEYNRFDNIFFSQVSFLLIVLSLGVYFVKKSNFENEKDSNISLYIITVIICYLILNIRVPIFSFSAEPYGEIATNFLENANRYSILKNLFISDEGYLPLIQRILTLIVVKIININNYYSIWILQNLGILIISLISSMFVLSNYKKYGNIYFRFIISLIIGTVSILPYTDSHSFINFSYFGIVFLILVSLLDLNNISKKWYSILITVSFLFCISKSHYVILFPIVLILICSFYKKIKGREIKFLYSILLGSLFQIIFMMNYISNVIKVKHEKLTVIEYINIFFYQISQQVAYIFFPKSSINYGKLINIIFLILFLLLVLTIIYLLKLNITKERSLLLILLFVIIGTTIYNMIPGIWIQNINWNRSNNYYLTRHSFFINMSLIYIIIILNYEFNKIKQINAINFMIFLFFVFRFSIFDNGTIYLEDSYSDWKLYSKEYKKSSYLIPLDPYTLHIYRNIKIKYIGRNSRIVIGKIVFVPQYSEDNTLLRSSLNQISEYTFEKEIYISELYVTRLRSNNFDKLKIVLYDNQHNIVDTVIQENDEVRKYIKFKNRKLNKKIKKISFFNEKNEKAFIVPELVIGCSN